MIVQMGDTLIVRCTTCEKWLWQGASNEEIISRIYEAMMVQCSDCMLKEDRIARKFAEGYERGYKDGYEWLTIARRKHYKESGGYIPGGPCIFTEDDHHINRGWRDGWKDGVDRYCTDNNLKY